MERTEISKEQLNSLLSNILPIVLEKGPSHTTMDHVASTLGISKRTLYEIFGSKDDMLRQVLYLIHSNSHQAAENIFRNSENMMEALVKLIRQHQAFLEKTSPSFFKDMDERSKHLRPHYDSRNDIMNRYIARIINTGIQQGMFRKNCDYEMQIRLLRVHIESIKRMEDYFPPEITISQAFRSIGQGFLRSIATQKGIEYLDMLEENREF